MAEIDLTPTEEMAANAARGLELRRKHGKGGTEIGVARARDISNRKNLSPETVRRMHAFFSRHEKNKAGGEDDAGYIAWLLWGGDSGQSWAKRKVEQMDKGENQRSDTYKEIAQRLGSVAKFAITKEQIRGASREELRSIEQRLQALAKSGDKNAAALLDYVEEEYNDRYRGTHSRPGAKAKMAVEAGWRVSPDAKSSGLTVTELLPKLAKGHTFYANLKSGGTVSGTLKAFSTSGVKIDKYGDVTDLRWSDIASIGAGNIGTGPYPIRASRPGAKAKFAADAREVGNEILRQLGGGRFMSMVGGKNAMYGMFGGKPGLQVSIGKGAEGGINRVIVTLDPATDTYRMEFWKIAKGGMSTQKVSEASMVYADDLQRVFTDRTRFYTSMSRPGAKAKMGRAEQVMRDGSVHLDFRAAKEWLASVSEDALRYIINDAQKAAKAMPDGNKWNYYHDLSLTAQDELQRRKKNASRPGAKVANAVREGEKVSASDDAVSRKIRKLMDEGKPQKQAVAIALDLERRGELFGKHQKDTFGMWTVWEFRSVDGKQVKRVLRKAEPGDQKYVHEYQRILYRGEDFNKAKSLAD